MKHDLLCYPHEGFTLSDANVAQLVERVHGKDEVPSSILGIGSKIQCTRNKPSIFYDLIRQ